MSTFGCETSGTENMAPLNHSYRTSRRVCRELFNAASLDDRLALQSSIDEVGRKVRGAADIFQHRCLSLGPFQGWIGKTVIARQDCDTRCTTRPCGMAVENRRRTERDILITKDKRDRPFFFSNAGVVIFNPRSENVRLFLPAATERR